MIADMGTVIWKEWKEIFLQRGSLRGGLLNLAIIIGLMGVFLPLQMGVRWLTDIVGLATWSWLPLFLVMGVVADAFAGERERHTLETLLASRLPDRAILFGKIGAAVLYGWSIVLISILLGAVTVNVSHPSGFLQFYAPVVLFSSIAISLLASIFMASAGVLVSLHSSTTRQAYQKMSVAFLVVWFVPVILLRLLPVSVRTSLAQTINTLNGPQVLVGALAFLILVDAILIAISMSQFRRSRLILD